jgi:septum site-determining protein MinC
MAPTLLVRRTVRSGQRVRFNGNVVVLGDVNPGAEIVAAGDIVVMGTLRGVAHAGATGASDAQVVALRLQPVQLRVGSVIGRAPDGGVPHAAGPEAARVQDGVLVVERFAVQGGETP